MTDDLLRGNWAWSDRAPSNVADLGIVYRTLKNKWVFEDLPNSSGQRRHENTLEPTPGNSGI
jgi:hypothetical protein